VDFLQKQGFGIIAAEDFSVLEQAALFSSARMIVSLHGAGLSNLAFCEPGTKIIEIFHPKSVHPLYWTLSHQADLDYFYLLGVGDISPEGVDEFLSQKDITIDLGALKKIIAMASS
jgi:capsular polysaccharide biosynthesis protein